MSEIEAIKAELDEVKKQVIMLQQNQRIATRNEPVGTTTVGELTQMSDTQLDDDPAFYAEHPEGGFRVNMSQIVAQAQENIPAEKVTSGVFDTNRMPSAAEAVAKGEGYGCIRYRIEDDAFILIVE